MRKDFLCACLTFYKNTPPQLVADEKGVFGTVFQKFFIFYLLHKRTLRDLGSKKAPAKMTSAARSVLKFEPYYFRFTLTKNITLVIIIFR